MTSEPPSESSPVVPVEETKWWEIHAELQVNNKLCYFENDMKIWGVKVEQTKRKLIIINNSDYVQHEEDGSKFFFYFNWVGRSGETLVDQWVRVEAQVWEVGRGNPEAQ